jgi:hypothetical protein
LETYLLLATETTPPTIFESTLSALLTAALTLFSWVGPVLILCFALHVVARSSQRLLHRLAGRSGVLIMASIGTPIHELSHVLGCFLGGHKVEEVSLFRPDSKTGQLGYVTHSWNRKNFWQNYVGKLMVSVAPFFGGALAMAGLTALVVPQLLKTAADAPDLHPLLTGQWDVAASTAGAVLEHIFKLVAYLFSAQHWSDWSFYIFLFAIFSIGSHLAPSGADWKNTRGPILMLLFIWFVAVTIVKQVGGLPNGLVETIGGLILWLDALLLFALFINMAMMAVLGLFRLVQFLMHGRPAY